MVMFGWTYEQLGGTQGAAARVSRMLTDPAFEEVGTVCVHSDTADAPALARAVRDALRDGGVALKTV